MKQAAADPDHGVGGWWGGAGHAHSARLHPRVVAVQVLAGGEMAQRHAHVQMRPAGPPFRGWAVPGHLRVSFFLYYPTEGNHVKGVHAHFLRFPVPHDHFK